MATSWAMARYLPALRAVSAHHGQCVRLTRHRGEQPGWMPSWRPGHGRQRRPLRRPRGSGTSRATPPRGRRWSSSGSRGRSGWCFATSARWGRPGGGRAGRHRWRTRPGSTAVRRYRSSRPPDGIRERPAVPSEPRARVRAEKVCGLEGEEDGTEEGDHHATPSGVSLDVSRRDTVDRQYIRSPKLPVPHPISGLPT